MKRELEVMEEEYEQRISDLQADLNQVRSKITEAEVSTRYAHPYFFIPFFWFSLSALFNTTWVHLRGRA